MLKGLAGASEGFEGIWNADHENSMLTACTRIFDLFHKRYEVAILLIKYLNGVMVAVNLMLHVSCFSIFDAAVNPDDIRQLLIC